MKWNNMVGKTKLKRKRNKADRDEKLKRVWDVGGIGVEQQAAGISPFTAPPPTLRAWEEHHWAKLISS